MQRHTSRVVLTRTAFAVGLLVGFGCSGPVTPAPSPKPFAGTSLTIACPDPAFARELSGRCAGWAARTGATVQVAPQSPDTVPAADIAVLRPPELGAFAARGELASMPAALREPSHPLNWGRITSVYQSVIPSWGKEVVGLPLAGDCYVLVYQSDRLVGKDGKPLTPPATWEDLIEKAATLAADGKPSLPPLPTDGTRLLAEFQHIAACYDRKAAADADRTDVSGGLTLHFRSDTWEPRLDTPAFVAAADWFHQTREFRPAGTGDPVAALETGTAAMAILSLAELDRLPKKGGAVAPEYRVASLPGTRSYFDAKGQSVRAGAAGNFVPFLGFGGQVGVVFQRSPVAAAAWDLLAELASPSAGVALLSNPALGAGPYRSTHTQPVVWLGYGFAPNQNENLARAADDYLRVTVTNPYLALRTPDQAELMTALETEVRQAATGKTTGAEAMKRANDAWKKHDAGKNPDDLKRWRRNAIGLP